MSSTKSEYFRDLTPGAAPTMDDDAEAMVKVMFDDDPGTKALLRLMFELGEAIRAVDPSFWPDGATPAGFRTMLRQEVRRQLSAKSR